MKNKINLNEKFQRMQTLAGIINENTKVGEGTIEEGEFRDFVNSMLKIGFTMVAGALIIAGVSNSSPEDVKQKAGEELLNNSKVNEDELLKDLKNTKYFNEAIVDLQKKNIKPTKKEVIETDVKHHPHFYGISPKTKELVRIDW